MANLNRGEHDIDVNGQTYAAVLTLDDLVNLENILDLSGDALFQQIRTNAARIAHVNLVIVRALQKGKPRLTKKEAEELLPQIPFPDRKTAAGMLVAGALNYLNEQQQEAAPDEDKGEQKGKPFDPLSSTTENLTGAS